MTAPVPGEENSAKTGSSKSGKGSGNVRVVSRVRPLAKYEIEKGCQSIVVKVPNLDKGGPETLQINQGDKRWFELDAVLDEQCSQQDLYEQSGAFTAISEDLFEGFNCTILAYGQTGSGKTFSMGTAAENVAQIGDDDGLIPRAVQDLFATIQSKCDSNAHVELSYLEVYNEEIRDLLSGEKNNEHLRIRETLDGEVYVRGLEARTVSNPADVGTLMEEASGRRVVASTKMNATSSRSHAICVLRIKGVLEDSTKFQSKLTLVDLAGSERIKKTMASGSRAQEGISINKGLFVLGQVVSALAEQRPKFKRKPPFRDSKLTRLLQDSLGGNSRTIMIACCSPADFNIEETINTLRYATQARNIKNTATANVLKTISQEEALKLQRENTLLKQQVAELQDSIRKLTADVTQEDLNRSRANIQDEQRKSMIIRPSSGSTPPVSPIPTPSQKIDPSSLLLPNTPEMEHPPPEDKSVKEQNTDMSLGAHFGPQPTGDDSSDDEIKKPDPEEEISLVLEDVLPGIRDDGGASKKEKKSYEELEEENNLLEFQLKQAQGDVRASLTESAIELPALKVRLMMLEEELNESVMLEKETMVLKQELEEAKADRESATLAARQLSQFMDRQKSEHGFRGDELEKKRMWYFHKRLDEKWVDFCVIMLSSFKEQMRLLGDYFAMVVQVVESPDILTMLGPKASQRKNWWGGKAGDGKEVGEEKELRHRLLGEHIKFFNARLLEIEDEINNRSESVDGILEGLCFEREELEKELDETEFVLDLFSKKGEKLLKHMTVLMTGPLFSLPLIDGSLQMT
jgi:hypothetical protein